MLNWSTHHLATLAEEELGPDAALDLRKYAQKLINQSLPVIFTLRHLAHIVDVDYKFLRASVNRDREVANYRIYAIRKRSGGKRYIHALCNELHRTQTFLNSELLQKTRPHTNSFAFHSTGGIRRCAAAHCGARWMFQFDLDNFFHRITERDVYNVYESLGYRPLLALELARISTTTYIPRPARHLLKWPSLFGKEYAFYNDWRHPLGVLPQGGPSSPMLSNLVASELDKKLGALAMQYGLVVTRYADDITFSTNRSLPDRLSVGKLKRLILHTIRQCGFRENPKKIRIAGPGSRKIVLGLLVDGESPRISRETYRRIDRYLYASQKYGIIQVATHEGFDTPFGFYNHLHGLVNFVDDVDSTRGPHLSKLAIT